MSNYNFKVEEIDCMFKAIEISKKSKAQKRQVGAVIVDEYYNVLSEGFNRMPKDFDEVCENSEGETFECVIHAEEDAIFQWYSKAREPHVNDKPYAIYCTFTPCMNCSKLIVHAGLKKLYYNKKHAKNFTEPEIKGGISPYLFLTKMGVECLEIPDNLLENQNKIALIYHSADVDGYMSGTLFKISFEKELNTKEAVLIPYNYEKTADWMDNDSFEYYIFADVTPPIEWLIKMEDKPVSIVICDHHKPKFEEIYNQIPFDAMGEISISKPVGIQYYQSENGKISYYFHTDFSGCYILMEFLKKYENLLFFKINNVGFNLIETISLWDTWQFVDETKCDTERINNINVYLFSYINPIDGFDKFFEMIWKTVSSSIPLDEMETYGSIINKSKLNDIKQRINNGLFVKGKYNLFICEGYPEFLLQQEVKKMQIDYLLTYRIDFTKNEIKFSLRSECYNNCVNIAQYFGGNGHQRASGFSCEMIQESHDFITIINRIIRYIQNQ